MSAAQPLRLLPEATALVVIDPQAKLVPAVLEPERLLRSTGLLLRAARALKLPVIATTQYQRGLGPLVKEVEELLPESTARLDKTAFSCFDDERFASLLAAHAPGARTLLVAGIETHICVAGTVLGARRLGFDVALAVDASSARGALDRDLGLDRMAAAGAVLLTAEAAVYELVRDSKSPAFREILPYLKG